MVDKEDIVKVDEELALRRRAERKITKRMNAAARESYVTVRTGYVDRDSLRASMAALVAGEEDLPEAAAGDNDDDTSPRAGGPVARAAPAPMAFPGSNVNRWVPIGPTTVRRGQADGRPQVSGRVRDLQVSAGGRRAYAATAKGGIWYTADGGATWEPVGGWASEPRQIGGHTSAFASGCLLVHFGANAAAEFVMVGTGETGAFQTPIGAGATRGMGILVASAPSSQALQADPWEPATGIGALEGVSVVRMVRVPGSAAGQNGDQVIAATMGRPAGGGSTGGLFLGTRTVVGGAGSFAWAPLASPAPAPAPAVAGLVNVPDPTDLIYVGARLFVCFRHSGVAVSDNNGTSFRWVPITLNAGLPAASILTGRMSLAVNDDGTAVYVLGEVNPTPGVANPVMVPHIWQIANPGVAAPVTPAALPLAGVPANNLLWGGQRDYDQAIAVTTYTPAPAPPPPPPPVRIDRIYIGGSLVGRWLPNNGPLTGLGGWNASIWAFDVAGAVLNPAPGVGDQPVGVTHGANLPGYIGNAVHPDVHALRTASNPDGTRQIWVGCDGGVFASLQDGQANTFASRNNGLASIEVGFIASHPTSSHFVMLGCQDNGRQIRVGESVWELKTTMQGDGGGVLFHPIRSEIVLGQFVRGAWAADPSARYQRPLVGPAAPAVDQENRGAEFYSGIAATVQAPANRARIALGTNRVWLTDDLGSANPNTWNVLDATGVAAPVAARDPRPGNRLPGTAANQLFGVPLPPAAITAATRTGALGAVVTVKWASPTTLFALYRQGVVRYAENVASPGNWTSTILLQPGMAAPAAPLVVPAATMFTDIEPVPGSNDFYLIGTGQTTAWQAATPATPAAAGVPAVAPTLAADTCFYFDNAAGGFRTTGLGQALPRPPGTPLGTPSPIDPAFSVVVDPANVNNVYVGTVTAVWLSSKAPATNLHGPWVPVVNGLPESAVQDLSVWTDPAGGANSPRLLRAALQSRGVWEVNLANPEPVRTYLRVHERDDRRMFPTPLKNPRRRPNAPDVSATRSPDIVVRPEAAVTNTPSFRGRNLVNGTFSYQLWTFQTAFRWLFPSVIPDGRWTDQFADLVERHRLSLTPPLSGARRIDRALWNSVMANAVDENNNPGVYRAPWQNALAPTLPGSEIDLIDTVLPRRNRTTVWQVYRERSTVDILLHHRDTRPVAANGAGVVLLWRTGRSEAALTAESCADIPAYARSQFAVPDPNPPGTWNVVPAADGTGLHRLGVPLAARMPRAVSINLDLSAIPSGNRVMLLALAGSTADPFSAPFGAVDRVDNFARNWPHAAARVISCWRRPGTQIH